MTTRNRDNVVSFILLCAILVLAALLRIDRARADGLTFDEIWHLVLSTGRGSPQITLPKNLLIESAPAVTSMVDAPPIWHTWTRMEGVVHPPLFVTLLRIWRTIFGESDLAAKSLSITCAIIAIGLLHEAIRTQISIGAARWAALIFTVAPAQIYLSQQVRGYALAQMLACAVILCIVRIEKLGVSRARATGLCLFAASLALTHYFGILALLALGAYIAIRFRATARKHSLIALAIAAAIFLLAWAPFMWRLRGTIAQMADPWLAEPASVSTMQHIWLTLGRMLALPVRQIAEPTNAAFHWPLIVGTMIFIAFVALAIRRRELLIWIFYLLGTLVAIALLDLIRDTRQLAFPRYTALAAPAIVALLASIRSPKHVLPIAAIAFALMSYPTAFTRDDEPDWRKLGVAIDQHCKPGAPLIFYSGSQVFWYHEILFLASSHYGRDAFPRPIVRMTEPPITLTGDTAWLISGPLDRPIEQIIPGAQQIEQMVLPPVAVLTRVRLSPR